MKHKLHKWKIVIKNNREQNIIQQCKRCHMYRKLIIKRDHLGTRHCGYVYYSEIHLNPLRLNGQISDEIHTKMCNEVKDLLTIKDILE